MKELPCFVLFCFVFYRYVKCYLVPDKTKLGKRKTTVRKKNLNPNYNEILRVRIPYVVNSFFVFHIAHRITSSLLSSPFIVQNHNGGVKNGAFERLSVAQRHLWAEQLPGRGGPGFVRVGLQQHTDQ